MKWKGEKEEATIKIIHLQNFEKGNSKRMKPQKHFKIDQERAYVAHISDIARVGQRRSYN